MTATTQTPRNQNVNTSVNRVIAFFKNKEDAYRAIDELRGQGFTSSDIGVIEGSRDVVGAQGGRSGDESMWQKIKDFFTGESHNDSDYGYDYDESVSAMNWDRNRANYYYQGVNAGGALVSVSGTRAQEARRILQNAGGDLRETGFEGFSSGWNTNMNTDTTPERRIQLRGEILRTYKERVQRGEVRLRKDVITENQSVQVPVTREELVVERGPASGEAHAGERLCVKSRGC
jgi:stress response protein YsnF